ncbi:MAG: hypothetical protein A2408_03450 [Candidatus Yonathbacteria bacterium RIFOXYC1_FULL_52_10]|uniref:Uncharacterized protein n=1 Tax=Candidatus Yonathbacteria bacterium RIFOXYD1_FULL_52_36 TaxID=1802730 RepID=A0A1G2SLQ4_9BACT|nr:MAG: hypothetical protein A2408_03450 [Candidatus Yonathbacteria bacterium RIFOXYC1_FULL_52_10]OHA85906.1 MAG: hypothetical protein A2591_04305 [Candidatus Yonathbacteria bacterium RIFOXYD1_FULL_52_36]
MFDLQSLLQSWDAARREKVREGFFSEARRNLYTSVVMVLTTTFLVIAILVVVKPLDSFNWGRLWIIVPGTLLITWTGEQIRWVRNQLIPNDFYDRILWIPDKIFGALEMEVLRIKLTQAIAETAIPPIHHPQTQFVWNKKRELSRYAPRQRNNVVITDWMRGPEFFFGAGHRALILGDKGEIYWAYEKEGSFKPLDS